MRLNFREHDAANLNVLCIRLRGDTAPEKTIEIEKAKIAICGAFHMQSWPESFNDPGREEARSFLGIVMV